MLFKWFPWRSILRITAQRHGFIDPIKLIVRLGNFAQPAEVAAPLELVRAGVILHARGLVNSQAIQHNLDWIWPFWVEKQFNPRDPSFIPRAFSVTHINLTHRNWTAVGLPDQDYLPIVDPRGLVTPLYDGWSVDTFVLSGAEAVVPSRNGYVSQNLKMNDDLSVLTKYGAKDLQVEMEAKVERHNNNVFCCLYIKAASQHPAFLAVSIRPYNPEGISFIEDLSVRSDGEEWIINRKEKLYIDTKPDVYILSTYKDGDVFHKLKEMKKSDQPFEFSEKHVTCQVGMATGAAGFELAKGQGRLIKVRIPLHKEKETKAWPQIKSPWEEALSGACKLELPDKHFEYIFKSAVCSLILHSPNEVYPGPFTYKRFWFRDAALILNALLTLGMPDRVDRALNNFPSKQTAQGYFLSQDGEWDANGEAIWIIWKYMQISGKDISTRLKNAVIKGAQWIIKKRSHNKEAIPYSGLFPPGFSAEHLGPNNYYYWDDYWGAAGLESAAKIMRALDETKLSGHFEKEAQSFLVSIENSLNYIKARIGRDAIPVSPNRRLDSGAVGSLVAGYPLQIYNSKDIRLIDTVNYLYDTCMINYAFFHDLTHSGINPYLTLHIAQTMLRAGDPRFFYLVGSIAKLASSTGKWPEAIHPATRGGCMGDGEHVWAAAEWVMMLKNMFILEEKEQVLICQGIPEEWLAERKPMKIGPLLTESGKASIKIEFKNNEIIADIFLEKWPLEKDVYLCFLRQYKRLLKRGESRVVVSLDDIYK